MPSLSGLSLGAAERKIRLAHFRVGTIERRTSTLLRANHVLEQKPEGGRKERVGTRILLVVGRGPRTGTLPSLGPIVPRRLPPYIAYDPPTGGIWLIKLDGSDAHRVGPTDATGPVWSPDATRILYTAPAPQNDQGVSTELYLMNANGTDQHPIMPADGGVAPDNWYDSDFQWSPDGKQIVYTSQSVFSSSLEVVNADGSDSHVVPNSLGGRPSFSPDGNYLVYEFSSGHVTSAPAAHGLYLTRLDGTDQRQITFGGGAEDASWAPAGSRIIYGCLIDRSGLAHAVCELSGSPTRQRILYMNRNQLLLHPTWNADGTKILLTVAQENGGPGQLALMSPSGGRLVKTGVFVASGTFPDW